MELLLEHIGPIFEAISNKNIPLVASLILVALVSLARKQGVKKLPWLGTKAGGHVLTYAMSLAVSLAATFSGGVGFSLGVLYASAKVAFLASGGYTLAKDLLLPLLSKVVPAWALKPVEMILDNTFIKAKAEEAGLRAVKENPGEGVSELVGEPESFE